MGYGGIKVVYNHPIGRNNTTYIIPLIVLASWGPLYATYLYPPRIFWEPSETASIELIFFLYDPNLRPKPLIAEFQFWLLRFRTNGVFFSREEKHRTSGRCFFLVLAQAIWACAWFVSLPCQKSLKCFFLSWKIESLGASNFEVDPKMVKKVEKSVVQISRKILNMKRWLNGVGNWRSKTRNHFFPQTLP